MSIDPYIAAGQGTFISSTPLKDIDDFTLGRWIRQKGFQCPKPPTRPRIIGGWQFEDLRSSSQRTPSGFVAAGTTNQGE